MKIGVVVDGVSEFASLAGLYSDLQALGCHQILKPAKADIQPYAPIAVIARQCSPKVSQFLARGAQKVLVLLDREQRNECPGEFARQIAAAIIMCVGAGAQVEVVVKDRAYENWAIADLDALRALPGRFAVSKATANAVEKNKADQVDALVLLKRCAIDKSYDKVADSKAIMARAKAQKIASHSRSFRKFMRAAGCPVYSAQSLLPVAEPGA